MKKRSHSLRTLALAGCILAAMKSLAGAQVYIGGAWNDPNSWDEGFVPQDWSRAQFVEPYNGNVDVGDGAIAEMIHFSSNASGYDFVGNGFAAITVKHLQFEGTAVSIRTDLLRGMDTHNGRGVLVIGGPTFGSGTNLLQVYASVEDARVNNDAFGSSLATDIWVSGTFHNAIMTTGRAHLFGLTEITGYSGRIGGTGDVVISRGHVTLDNQNNGANSDRLFDSATLTFDAGDFRLGASFDEYIDERIGYVHVRSGASAIRVDSGAQLSFGTLYYSALTRDQVARGTMLVDSSTPLLIGPANTGLSNAIPNMIPYLVASDGFSMLPAIFDGGDDGVPGNFDDVGIRGVQTMSLDSAISQDDDASHAHVHGTETINVGSPRLASLTIDGQLDLAGTRLIVSSGVVVINSTAAGNTVAIKRGGPLGRLDTAVNSEMFIYNNAATAEIDAQITGNQGLTITNGPGSPLHTGTQTILSGFNAYGGPTTVNGGTLVLRTPAAINMNGNLRLANAAVHFDFIPSGTFNGRLILDGDAPTPVGGRNGFIRDITIKDGQTLTFNGSIEGNGAYFLKGNGSTMIVNTPAGTASTTPGEFSIWPMAGATLRVDGQLGDANVSPGGVIQFGGRTVGRGRITAGVQLSEGELAPGSNGSDGTAVLRMRSLSIFDGDLRFHINGTARGTQYDALDIDQNFFISGSSSRIIIEPGGITGMLGQRFELIRYDRRFAFGTTTLVNPLPTQAGARWVEIIHPTHYELAVAGPNGDSNLDGTVGFDDLLVVAQNYNGPGNWLDGDFTNDGLVNFDDLLVLSQNYGSHLLSVAPGQTAIDFTALSSNFAADWAMAQSLVPEPTSMLALAALFGGRRRRSNAKAR